MKWLVIAFVMLALWTLMMTMVLGSALDKIDKLKKIIDSLDRSSNLHEDSISQINDFLEKNFGEEDESNGGSLLN